MKTLFLIFLCSLGLTAQSQIYWLEDYDLARKVAKDEQKFIVMDFWATWCGPCQTMDRTMWNNPIINGVADKFIPLKVNVDQRRDLATQYAAKSIPKVVIMDAAGNIVWEQIGFAKAEPFLEVFAQLPPSELSKDDLLKEENKNGDLQSWKALAVGYQNMGKDIVSVKLKNGFFDISDKYFRKIEKSANDENLQTEAKLHKILNMAYRGRTKQALKQLDKNENLELEFAYFVNAYCYKCLGNTEEMQRFLDKITDRNLLAQLE